MKCCLVLAVYEIKVFWETKVSVGGDKKKKTEKTKARKMIYVLPANAFKDT